MRQSSCQQRPTILVRVKGSSLVGFVAIGIGSACGARSLSLDAGEIDGGEPEDAAVAMQMFDSAQPPPPDSALGLSGDGAITRPMQTVDAMLPMQPVDATLPIGTDDGSSACTQYGGGGGASNTSCMVNYGEMCGATSYQVVCSCPQATCVCFGPTTHVVSYMFCPSCNLPPSADVMNGQAATAKVLAACGFP